MIAQVHENPVSGNIRAWYKDASGADLLILEILYLTLVGSLE
jgi:hypothetical protein